MLERSPRQRLFTARVKDGRAWYGAQIDHLWVWGRSSGRREDVMITLAAYCLFQGGQVLVGVGLDPVLDQGRQRLGKLDAHRGADAIDVQECGLRLAVLVLRRGVSCAGLALPAAPGMPGFDH